MLVVLTFLAIGVMFGVYIWIKCEDPTGKDNY